MFINLSKRDQKVLIIFIPGILILWKLVLFLDLPYPNFDGPWSLSAAFSILNGKFLISSFAEDYWIPFQLPPAYGFISAGFFSVLHPLSNTYSIFFYNIILIISAILLSNFYFDRKKIYSFGIKLIVFVSLLTTTDIYNQRYELLNINLLLVLLIILDGAIKKISNTRVFIISFLTAIIGMVHPVGGVFAIGLSTLITIRKNFLAGFFVKYYLLTALIVTLIYLPVIMLDFNQWNLYFVNLHLSSSGGDYHEFSQFMVFKYILLSPFSFSPYLLLLFTKKYGIKKILFEVGLLFLFLFIFAFFGRYYYFTYIFVFIVWRTSIWEIVKPVNSYVILSLLLSPVFTHYIPTVSQIVNREYVTNFRNVMNHIGLQDYFLNHDRVFVSSPVSMELIDHPDSRLLHSEYPSGKNNVFEKDDIALVTDPDFFKILKQRFNLDNSMIDVKLIINPMEEKLPLHFRSKFEDKHVTMGLWEVRLKSF